jgi:hypothetical protein
MVRELFVWGKYVTYNYFREKTKFYKRNPRQVAGAPFPSPTPFSLPPLYILIYEPVKFSGKIKWGGVIMLCRFGLQDVGIIHSRAIIKRTILEHGSAEKIAVCAHTNCDLKK